MVILWLNSKQFWYFDSVIEAIKNQENFGGVIYTPIDPCLLYQVKELLDQKDEAEFELNSFLGGEA